MAGGGIKGLANAPAFHLLNDAGVLEGIETCIGSSVGGLNAAALALGNNPDEIEQLLRSGGDGLLDLFSTSPVFASGTRAVGRVLKHLVQEQSAAKGYALYEKAQSSVASKLGNPHATFSDLSKKMGETSESGGKFRNLELTVTVADPRGSYQIVCSPETTPNMPIALAMRMTAGLPPVFPVVRISPIDLKKYTQGATEPLVKYDRGNPFPPYDAKAFFQLDKEKKQAYIQRINNDIFGQNGLNCSDGGAVDNLPIYLAMNKKNASVENTIGFFFEEPIKKKLREQHREMYQEGTKIDQDKEQLFLQKSAPNNFIRTAYLDYVAKPRTPPSHRLALLQQKNLLCFDVDNISSADFELETDKHMTHEQKKDYLLHSGYETTQEYLSSKVSKEIYEARKPFDLLYPKVPEAKLDIDAQINIAQNQLKTWEEVLSALSNEVKMSKIYEGDIKDFHVFIRQAKKNQKRHIHNDLKIEQQLNRVQDFSERNIVAIINAKKESRAQLEAAVESLGQCQRLNYMLSTKFKPYKKILNKSNPELVEKIDEMVDIKKNTELMNDLLSTTRDKSVTLQAESKRTTLDKASSKVSHNISALFKYNSLGSAKSKKPDRPQSSAPKLHLYDKHKNNLVKSYSAVFQATDVPMREIADKADKNKNVTKIDVFPAIAGGSSMVLCFQTKQKTPPIKLQVAEHANKKTNFSIAHLSPQAYENKEIQKVVQFACESAIFSAKPNAKISIPSTLSEGNQKMVLEALHQALEKAMKAKPPKFSPEEIPKLPDLPQTTSKLAKKKKSL